MAIRRPRPRLRDVSRVVRRRRPRIQRCVMLPNRSRPRRYTIADAGRIVCYVARQIAEGESTEAAENVRALRVEVERCAPCVDPDERRPPSSISQAFIEMENNIGLNLQTLAICLAAIAALLIFLRFAGQLVRFMPILIRTGVQTNLIRFETLQRTLQLRQAANAQVFSIFQQAANNAAFQNALRLLGRG